MEKFMKKIEVLILNLQVLTELAEKKKKQITQAQEGATKKSANLMIGSLAGVDQTASHIKHIYEAMLFIHRK